MAYEGLMVSVSGVRGRVGDGLSPEVVARFAAGFGAWAMARRDANGNQPVAVVVGRDSRVSGALFQRGVQSALESTGCHVIDIGLTTTPTCQMAVEHHHAAGGLMISASHNPIEWNALKFIGPSGLFLDPAEGAAMRAVVEGDIPRATWDRLGDVTVDGAAVGRHVEQILALPWLDVERLRARAFHVALDCCHGAGATIMPALLERLGCRVTAINVTPDGRFPRSPEPIVENLGELEELVRRSGADVGFAVDPDVDRLALVSDAGRAIGEDYTLALAIDLVLRHRPGAVVTNLSTSLLIDAAAERRGQRVERAPVGEVNVAVRRRDLGAVIGGEGNGGVILPELHLGRDAPAGAAIILQLLLEEGRPLSAVADDYPRFAIVKDKLDRPSAPLDTVYAALTDSFAGATSDRQDGLRLAWPDAWLHVRPSGTEPIVRVIAEAPTTERARELIGLARAPLERLSL